MDETGGVSETRRLGDLVRELELRGMLRSVLAGPGASVATLAISGVAYDSRAVDAGQLFVAVPGAAETECAVK